MKNSQGEFIWYELLTTDADAAADFYTGILNWQLRDSGQPGMDYRIFSAGSDVAGLLPLDKGACEAGMKPVWLGYIGVDDLDNSLTVLAGAGCQIHMPATDIPGVGRLAMLSDPQDAAFYIMQGAIDQPSQAFDQNQRGHCCWNELTTSDPAAALSLYQQAFGWQTDQAMDMGELGVYQLMRYGHKDSTMGAICPRANPDMRPKWMFYFSVEDIDLACQQIAAGGGTVDMGPHEVPGGGFIVIGTDPQGADFALIGQRK